MATLPTGDPATFDLKIDGTVVASGVSDTSAGPLTELAGTHRVSEAASSGTIMANYTVNFDGDCDQDGTVHFSAFHPAICNITNVNTGYSNCANECNSPHGDCWNGRSLSAICVAKCDNQCSHPTLMVSEQLVPSTDPGRFNLQIDGTTHKANAGNGGATSNVALTLGQHLAGEGAVAGTMLSNYTTTFGGDCDASGKVVLNYGDSKQCQITSTRKPGTGADAYLTVNKVLSPSGDPGRFNLQIDGTTVAAAVGSGGSTGSVLVPAGSHSVSETAVPGTQLSDYNATLGGDCSSSGRVTLAAGDNKTCTITNHKRNKGCETACNITEGQCMAAAGDFSERQQCIKDQTDCLASCAQD